MDFLAQLNTPQREAVEHTEGPLLILAGAGSGKTRVITFRIVYLIRQQRVSPAHILAVTFTNKAAGEMKERVGKLLAAGQSPPSISTFHSFCVRLLRRDGGPLAPLRPGFTTGFSIYDQADQLATIKAVFRSLGLDEAWMQHRAALGRISQAKNQRLAPEQYFRNATDPHAEKLAVVYEHYETALRRANALDFDDLLLQAVRLLRHDEPTRGRAANRLHYLMVDEYQDTNRVQYELIRMLAEPRRNLCVVGDDDQSIYGWRGADIRNILDFERDFGGARIIRLEQNYRSTKNILDASGIVVAHNRERKGKKLWTRAEAGPPLVLYAGEDSAEEARFIAEYIEKFLKKNPQDRVGVLYRTNFQSRQIEEALRRAGRKYLLVGGLSFYERAEIKDMLAYLKAGMSARDSASLLRIINTPARGLGRSTVDLIERRAMERGLSAWEAIEDLLPGSDLSPRAQAALSSFRKLIDELREQIARQPLNELLVWLKQRTGYGKMLEIQDSLESHSRLENIDELINAAADAVERGETIQEFLDHSALVADTDDLDEASQVTLLTLHSAKGLEFPLVLMAGMEEGLFPHSRSSATPSGLEEERRLCYVGMTRARKQLVLTRAESRRRYGGGELEDSEPSRFLDEIPPALVEDLSPDEEEEELDLYTERRQARQIAAQYAGPQKTYNSAANIAEYFAARGIKIRSKRLATGRTPAISPAPAPARAPNRKPAKLGAGSQVRHPKFGPGTVLRREGEGDEAKLTISFPRFGVKKLFARYAALQQE